jgi:hypothetical protein
VFWALNVKLARIEFRSDEEVQETVHDWLCKQQQEFLFKRDSGGTNVSDVMGKMLENNTVLIAILVNKIYLQRFKIYLLSLPRTYIALPTFSLAVAQ